MSSKNPLAADKHVGSRVRMRRLMLGMSQEKLADQLGLTFQQVQKYEKGTNRVGASRLQHLSQILEVPVSFFFDDMPLAAQPGRAAGAGIDKSLFAVSDFTQTPDGLSFIKAFAKIKSPSLRRAIVRLTEEIATECTH
jgi:transcriptional regulator with XRE-family HTH domain